MNKLYKEYKINKNYYKNLIDLYNKKILKNNNIIIRLKDTNSILNLNLIYYLRAKLKINIKKNLIQI